MKRIESRINLVEGSFARIKLHKIQFAEYFYTQLYSRSPEVKPLFANTSIEEQSKKLYAALVLLVENLRHPKELERILLPLGKRHKDYGVIGPHYSIVSEVLLKSLQHFLKDEWTPMVKEAWERTLEDVTEAMLIGAGDAKVRTKTQSESAEQKSQETKNIEIPQNQLFELVENSFKKIKIYKEEFPLTFYKNLFNISPELQPLFENIEIKTQSQKLYGALLLLVENIRRPEQLAKVLGPLGDKHRGYGTTAEHYPLVGEALLMTLEEYLKDEWTAEVKQAWSETYSGVMDLMLKGAPGIQIETKDQEAEQRDEKELNSSKKESLRTYDANISKKQKSKLRKKSGLVSCINHWFWETEKWKIAVIISIIFFVIAPIKNEFLASIIDILEPLSIVLAVYLFIKETPERKKQFHYQAWSIVDSANGIKKSHARIIALQDLCDEGVSLKSLDLSNAELSKIELNRSELSEVNFAGSILKDAELFKADLSNAVLTGATCTGIILSHANLGFASLSKGNFSSADFSSANLMFADMSKGNFSGADFSNAQMKGAKFEGAYMSGANFKGAEVHIEDLQKAYILNAIMPDGSIIKDNPNTHEE